MFRGILCGAIAAHIQPDTALVKFLRKCKAETAACRNLILPAYGKQIEIRIIKIILLKLRCDAVLQLVLLRSVDRLILTSQTYHKISIRFFCLSRNTGAKQLHLCIIRHTDRFTICIICLCVALLRNVTVNPVTRCVHGHIDRLCHQIAVLIGKLYICLKTVCGHIVIIFHLCANRIHSLKKAASHAGQQHHNPDQNI